MTPEPLLDWPQSCTCVVFTHDLLVAVHDSDESVVDLQDLGHPFLVLLQLAGHAEQVGTHLVQGGVQLLPTGEGAGGKSCSEK